MFDIRRSSVSTMISCVEKKGYIKRESIPTDKRINKIVLTEEGRKNDWIPVSPCLHAIRSISLFIWLSTLWMIPKISILSIKTAPLPC